MPFLHDPLSHLVKARGSFFEIEEIAPDILPKFQISVGGCNCHGVARALSGSFSFRRNGMNWLVQD